MRQSRGDRPTGNESRRDGDIVRGHVGFRRRDGGAHAVARERDPPETTLQRAAGSGVAVFGVVRGDRNFHICSG